MSETARESVRDTIEAALDASDRVPAPPPRRAQERVAQEQERLPLETPEPASTADASPPAELPATGTGKPRDQFGRFTKTLDGPAPGASLTGRSEPAEPPPPSRDQPELPGGEPEPPAIPAPVAWSAAAKDTWATLPRAVQEEVDRRERDVSRGFQERAQQIQQLEPIAQAIGPYLQKFTLRGVHPGAAIQQLLAVQDMLERDPIGGLAYVARSYGVDLRNYAAAADQAQRPQDPHVQAQTDRLDRLENFLRQGQESLQQQEMSRITQEVAAFQADTASHPYFEMVRPAMAQLMASSICTTLQDAYDQACWGNPQIRQMIQEAQRRNDSAARQKQEREAAERARRAAVSVHSAPAGGGGAQGKPNGKGGIRADIEAAIDQAVSR